MTKINVAFSLVELSVLWLHSRRAGDPTFVYWLSSSSHSTRTIMNSMVRAAAQLRRLAGVTTNVCATSNVCASLDKSSLRRGISHVASARATFSQSMASCSRLRISAVCATDKSAISRSVHSKGITQRFSKLTRMRSSQSCYFWVCRRTRACRVFERGNLG